mmetsp:Transcript_8524/g.13090  ORF Transcript_8524/g.13090 Transcript_8524/m.13090 type:complete len:646 (+) Transcript_8524:171-2108(+)
MVHAYEMSDKDKDHPDNKKLEHSADFAGPCEKRKCTDILFLLLIIACWVAMTFLGFVVTGAIPSDTLDAGNPERLINGIDYEGNICGVDSGVKSKSKIYYLPAVGTTVSIAGVCIDSCPSTQDTSTFICKYNVSDELTTLEYYQEVSSGNCMYQEPTTDIFNYCIYDTLLDAAESAAYQTLEEVMSSFNMSSANVSLSSDDSSDWFDDFTADIYTGKYVIFGFGIGVALVIGFVYLFLLRIPGVLFMLTWGIIFSILFLLLIGGVLCYTTASDWADDSSHTTTEANSLKYFSYFLFALTGVWLLLMLVLRKRIQLALKITKEASKAVASMKLLLIWPVIQTLGVLCFLIPWIIYVLYLASSGTVEVNNGIKTFTYSDNIRYAGLYLLFCWFWTSEFVIAMGQIVVAMAVSFWYFTMDRSSIGNGTVIKAIKQSMWYHTGTAAFGSLIIAIIKTIRAVIAYMQKKAKQSGNKLAQIVLCVIQCCMWCLEKCMKFLNKNAYIQTAIFGKSFCSAAKAAFFLIARNILRIAAVSLVGDFVLLIGRILIPVATTFLAYLALAYSSADYNGLWAPIIFVFLLAYSVALMFVEVFGMAISTCLQCFIADEEMGGHFSNQDLKGAIDETANEADSAGVHKSQKGGGAAVTEG